VKKVRERRSGALERTPYSVIKRGYTFSELEYLSLFFHR
jgi:hypothetical protein